MNYQNQLQTRIGLERSAVELIRLLGHLLYEKSVELVLLRQHLLNKSVSEVLNLHDYASQLVAQQITVTRSVEIAQILVQLDLAPAKIDIGKLALQFLAENPQNLSLEDFVKNRLAKFLDKTSFNLKPKDVILFGFGRIGRILARELVRQAGSGQQLRLRAIVTREVNPSELVKRAALLRNDSVHGSFKGSVEVDEAHCALIINGQPVLMLAAPKPEEIDYTAYGIQNALLIDNTGVYKDKQALSRHLAAKGVSKVILTAPGKGIPNVVYGINHQNLDLENDSIFSAASCTTNAICPILHVMEKQFGIAQGHIETVHAYTNDQNLLDNMHSKPRRGRSAAINMVITSTGAGEAVTQVIPELAGTLTANSVRVPTPNGSLAIISLTLKQTVDLQQVNDAVRSASLDGELVNQIYYSIDPELVSSDIIGNTRCSVFDSCATLISDDKKSVVLYTWYDNEFGYSKQVIRLAKHVAKVRRLLYY